MIIDIFGIEPYSWHNDNCLLCGSKNHIYIINDQADGFECWNCCSRWFFDDISKNAYMIVHGKTEQEAEEDLREANMPIIILSGQAQR